MPCLAACLRSAMCRASRSESDRIRQTAQPNDRQAGSAAVPEHRDRWSHTGVSGAFFCLFLIKSREDSDIRTFFKFFQLPRKPLNHILKSPIIHSFLSFHFLIVPTRSSAQSEERLREMNMHFFWLSLSNPPLKSLRAHTIVGFYLIMREMRLELVFIYQKGISGPDPNFRWQIFLQLVNSQVFLKLIPKNITLEWEFQEMMFWTYLRIAIYFSTVFSLYLIPKKMFF